MNMKKHFAKKLTNEDFKIARNIKLDKFLHKLAKDIKFAKSMKTMEILHDKSNTRLTTLLAKSTTSLTIINNMGVIFPDRNTMKSNATAS